MRNATYQRLAEFLAQCSKQELLTAFSEPWLNEIVPGMRKLIGCDQGKKKHLEGDAAVHTALVFENLSLTALRRLQRAPDFVEQFSVLLHDLKKPETRYEDEAGNVSFPGHEALAAAAIATIAAQLELTAAEESRAYFLVTHHGIASDYNLITGSYRDTLLLSPYIESVALLQEADALSCILADHSHLPVYWDELMQLRKTANL